MKPCKNCKIVNTTKLVCGTCEINNQQDGKTVFKAILVSLTGLLIVIALLLLLLN